MVLAIVFRLLSLWAGTASALCHVNGDPRVCSEAAQTWLSANTTNGLITGHFAANTTTGCAIEFLGIPYAKPPVGELRFAPPQRYVPTTQSYAARDFGFDCPLPVSTKLFDFPGLTPQAQGIMNYYSSSAGTSQSEDCLTLNIWTKPSSPAGTCTKSAADKPVLVFFYGGRFTVGNTNTPFYNGQHFAESQDVVIVTANYPLNIFGFPGASGEPQNLGLRDQRMAVEWIQRNIREFGGDPAKITISGQSASAVGVDYWAYAYPKNPIAHAIIAHSGTAFSFPQNTPSGQQANWNAVATAVNCITPTASTQNIMSCMRKTNWRAILAAAASLKPAKSSTILRPIPPFWPTPDNEIVFSPGEYLALTANGSFASLPILLGNTHNENSYYEITTYASQNGLRATDAQIQSFLLESFTCPVGYQAAGRRAHGVPAFVYRYMADWYNTRLFPGSGAYHGVDLHMIFGNSEVVSGGLATSLDQRKLTRLMQRAWALFARRPETGLMEELGWPVFDPEDGEKTLVRLGLANVSRTTLGYWREYAEGCGMVRMGGLWAGEGK